LSSQISIADAWIGRDTFYEERVAYRLRENRRFYQQLVRMYYSFLVPPGVNVLEIGCGLGDLLAEVKPAHGIGVDFSTKTIALAQQRHPEFGFYVGDAVSWQPPDGERYDEARERRDNAKSNETLAVKALGVASAASECDGLAVEMSALPGDVTRVPNFQTSPAALRQEFPDYILIAALINDLCDVQAVFQHLGSLSRPHTRLVLNFLNTLWRPALALAEWIGAKAPSMPQNWLSTADVKNLLALAGWEVIKEEHRILWPLRTPILATLLNRWLAPLLPDFCLTIFLVARPRPVLAHRTGTAHTLGPHGPRPSEAEVSQAADQTSRFPDYSIYGPSNRDLTCSIIIPARNEAGNIEAAVLRTPQLGLGTELIFVEGDSTDNTWAEVQRIARKYPQRNIKVLKQRNKGKGEAVRQGFTAATGDLLFILDADLAVPPEELPKFYEVIRSGTAEFVNGVRLVYPMEHEAMRFLNMIANKLFGIAFSWLLGQQLKDTLCGTKVLLRPDYERLVRNRSYFGEFDPFGDFDLLFGAAKLNLRMIDLPIRYRARTYGETNIRRWRHGWLLLRMVLFAARRLKFL
jgi:SAM-dependent methyltransferase